MATVCVPTGISTARTLSPTLTSSDSPLGSGGSLGMRTGSEEQKKPSAGDWINMRRDLPLIVRSRNLVLVLFAHFVASVMTYRLPFYFH